MPGSFQIKLGLLIALLLAVSGPASAQTPCTPPESMKSKFTGPPNPDALNDLGVWFGEQKNYTCAADAFATSLQLDPKQKDMPRIAFMFGGSLYFAGDTREAIAALREAEKFGYRDIKLHLLLAEALDSTKASADAEAEWRAALDIVPENAETLDSLSNNLIAGTDYQGVITLLDTARLRPLWSIQQCSNLGLAYARKGNLAEASRVLRDGANTYPDSLPLAEKLADVLTQIGKKDEAAQVLANAHQRQAGSAKPDAP
ncbi:MAG TPA: tetratricopeptide repeat protein [Terracidiphilus sp.]|nr:tetratricopeptide repeat protein [Terracidiphilus sp.]